MAFSECGGSWLRQHVVLFRTASWCGYIHGLSCKEITKWADKNRWATVHQRISLHLPSLVRPLGPLVLATNVKARCQHIVGEQVSCFSRSLHCRKMQMFTLDARKRTEKRRKDRSRNAWFFKRPASKLGKDQESGQGQSEIGFFNCLPSRTAVSFGWNPRLLLCSFNSTTFQAKCTALSWPLALN